MQDDFNPKGFVDADLLQLRAVETTTISGPVEPPGTKVTIGINWQCDCETYHISVCERSDSNSYQLYCGTCDKVYFVDAYAVN